MRTRSVELMTATVRMFLQPTVQHIGVHSMADRQCRDGGTGLLARGHQLGLELAAVRPVGAAACVTGIL